MKKALVIVLTVFLARGAFADTWYVDINNGIDASAGTTWASAKKTLQAAINVAVSNDTIIVTNGVYAPISSTKAIVIQSVNGAEVTVVDGGGLSRCATLGSTTVLIGFTLRNGKADNGGGSSGGTLRNCTLSGNQTWIDSWTGGNGGGSYGGTLNNCVLTGNRSTGNGGGSYGGTLTNCTLTGNWARDGGGGSFGGMLNNCTLSANGADFGSGSYSGTLNNCTLTGNSGGLDGVYGGGSYGGTLNNCTLVGNSARISGGGSYGGTLNNCIVWDNSGGGNYSGGAFSFSCTTPLPGGTGNIASNPLFRLPDDIRLHPGSPCLNKGLNSLAVGATDIRGKPRIQGSAVDMGAFEGADGFLTNDIYKVRSLSATTNLSNGITVSWQSPSARPAVLYRVFRLNAQTVEMEPVTEWMTNQSFTETQVYVEQDYTYAVAAAFDVALDEISGMSIVIGRRALFPWYVDATRPNDDGDGRTWATAKKSIQAAIDVATLSDYIVVTNGVYNPISADKFVRVQSVNGANVTIIDGGGASRCAKLGSQTVLDGFTLRNGNTSDQGGGSFGGTLNNCVLTGNSADLLGGGSSESTLNNCTLTGNSVVYGGILGNGQSLGWGGGSYGGTLNNCVLTDNSAINCGGGAFSCVLNNCTLTRNSATNAGGGSYGGTLNNCIVWDNSGGGNYSGGAFSFSCTTPLPGGTGNIASNPLFRLPDDIRLQPGSPCLDKGTNSLIVGSTDILGNPRIQGAAVDMGAVEGAGGFMTNDLYNVRNLLATTNLQNGIAISWLSPTSRVAVLYRLFRLNAQTGAMEPVTGWMTNQSFTDTQVYAEQDYTYAVVAAFDVALNDISDLGNRVVGRRFFSWYVDAARPNDDGDGRTWATAKKSIQVAIDLANSYDDIVVTNGTYAPICASNNIAIQSVNGADVTRIDGGFTSRCATLGSQAVLNGFTLRNGNADNGGGLSGGTLNNCMLTGNSASTNGGGSYGGTLNNCTLTGNSAAGWGGGSFDGTLNNCTLTGNSASTNGGGSCGGTLNNCIVWGNRLTNGTTNNYFGGTFSYSCATPVPSGIGNIASNPLFRLPEASDCRLLLGSPCQDKGTNSLTVGSIDILGNPRIQGSAVDMGAFEGVGGLWVNDLYNVRNLSATTNFSNGITVSWVSPSARAAVYYRVFRLSVQTGAMDPVSGWMSNQSFTDTQVYSGQDYTYAVAAAFDVALNDISDLSSRVIGRKIFSSDWYVDAARLNDDGDGRSWATAKKSIQATIDIANPYDDIIVTNGVYAPITIVSKTILIQSVNGAEVTVIDGGFTSRCAILKSQSVLIGFTLCNGNADNGGGSYGGTLNSCVFTGNSAGNGGGSYGGTLNNCMLTGNSAGNGGGSSGGTLNNCTLTGNSAGNGGGSSGGTLNNCIVWDNSGGGNYSGGAFFFTCTTPLPGGTGNIAANPLFRLPEGGDYRLLSGSPCLNKGSNSLAVGSTDILGNPRIQGAAVDMGAFEGAGGLLSNDLYNVRNLSATTNLQNGIAISWLSPTSKVSVLYRVFRLNVQTGAMEPVSGWMSNQSFTDTQVYSGQDYTYAVAAAFDVSLIDISDLSSRVIGRKIWSSDWYVDAARLNDYGDGRSWATAKKSIQSAIDLANQGDDIVVTNGVYAPITIVSKTILIQSVNGAEVTIIDGGLTTRCATLRNRGILNGFTLCNGNADNGGGSYGGTLNNCTLSDNSASTAGGGSYGGTLNNCTLTGNSATNIGGGSYGGTLNNCTLTANSAGYGGGSYGGTLNNCTLTGNSATISGGGSDGEMFVDALNNCIVWGNMLANGTINNYGNSLTMAFFYSCTTPLPGGTWNPPESKPFDGNITSNPLFRLPEVGDYQLLVGSPCLNKGANNLVVGSTDILGNPRIQGVAVDMGAFEGAVQLRTNAIYKVRSLSATTNLQNGITISWITPAPTPAVLYRVYRLNAQTGAMEPVSGWIANWNYTDTLVSLGRNYTYAVLSSFDLARNAISDLSSRVTGRLGAPKASQSIIFLNPGTQLITNRVFLAATAGSGLPVSFNVVNGPGLITSGSNLTFVGTGLVSVVATQAGDSNWNAAPPVTNVFQVSKATQTITFPNPGTQLTTNRVVLAATAGSGLPVIFAVGNGPGVITSGSNLTFTGTGMVSIVASQTGDSNWNPAAPVTNSFQISKATAAVTIPDVQTTYDGAAKSASATTAPAGLIVVLTYNGSASQPVNVGSYAVTGYVNDVMYQGVGMGTLSIGKGSQTITFNPIAPQYVTNVVQLAPTASSGLPVGLLLLSGPGVLSVSSNLSFTTQGNVVIVARQFGNANWNAAADIERTVYVVIATKISDYDGDGLSDFPIYDPSGGYWYIRNVAGNSIIWKNQWGWSTAKPVSGDYDGDGKFDLAVFDTAGGYWYIKNVAGNVISWANQWGWSTAKPIQGDYNGDGKYDMAVFDTQGGYWYIKSVSGDNILWKNQWGWSTAKPVPGDYDGDGKWDQAVFDIQGGYWYIKSVAGDTIFWKAQWGWSTAKPVPGDYDGDGKYDLAVFDTVGGYWYIKSLGGRVIAWKVQWGWSTAKPVPGDYNGDGKFDLAVYDTATGYWYIKSLDGTIIAWAVQWGWPGATVPTLGD